MLQALGIAALVQPASAFAQGQCGGAKKGTPECDPTPAKAPFVPTGWKTVMLDHLSCQVADYSKEAAYYAALMNWKIRSDDGKQALLDEGDWGGVVFRGGYQAPAFVLEADATVYLLSDQKAAERFTAQKVMVTGTLDPKTRTIQVESIAAVTPD